MTKTRGRKTKNLQSGICECDNCIYDRGDDGVKFKCVDCQKSKQAQRGEPWWQGYKNRHGPLCEPCNESYNTGYD